MAYPHVTLKKLYPLVHKDIFMPQFALRFRCLGPDCRFTCCQTFNIAFEKKYFDRLEKELPLFPADKMKYKKLGKSKRTDTTFAEFVHVGEHDLCGFLEGGICALHRDFGEDAIANVCYHYPRLFRAYRHDHTELTLSMSCIEAARLALLDADAFEFVIEGRDVRPEVLENRHAKSPDLAQLMFDVRLFCVQILQFKALAFWERLAILGLFSYQLAPLFAQPPALNVLQDEVAALIDSTSAFIQADDVRSIYAGVCASSDHLAACFSFLTRLQHEWEEQVDFLPLAKELIALAAGDSLRMQDTKLAYDFDVLCQNYAQGCEHLRQILADYPYFFEHLALSHLLYLSFPFNQDASLRVDVLYRHLIFSFVFLRFALAIYCRDGGRSVDDLLMVVMKIMRALHHSTVSILHDLMKAEALSWDDFAVLYASLKDDF